MKTFMILFIFLSLSALYGSDDEVTVFINEILSSAEQDTGIGMSSGQINFAQRAMEIKDKKKLQSQLISLLSHKSPNVQGIVTIILFQSSELSEEILPELMKIYNEGNYIIPILLLKIGTPAAAKVLVSEMKKTPSSGNPLYNSIVMMGTTAAVELVDVFNCQKDCDEYLFRIAVSIFKEMGEKAAPAVKSLIEKVRDTQNSNLARVYAAIAIGNIGNMSDETVNELEKIKADAPPEVKSGINEGFMKCGAKGAGIIFGERIKELEKKLLKILQIENKNEQQRKEAGNVTMNFTLTFRDLSEIGEKGIDAGPALTGLLKNGQIPLNIKEHAVRTIGYIKYKDAENELISLLENKYNWVIVFLSVESLGKIKSQKALQKLESISKNYWFGTVRESAKNAINFITNKDSNVYNIKENQFPFEYFKFKHLPRSNEKTIDPDKKCEKMFNKTVTDKSALNEQELEKTGYFVREKSSRWSYNTGIKIKDGYLLGANQGEFGGELIFYNKKEFKVIDRANVIGLVNSPDFGIVMAEGLNHMMTNGGALYKVIKDGKEGWKTEKWFELPARPDSLKLVKGGIVVETQKGDILIYGNDEIVQCR